MGVFRLEGRLGMKWRSGSSGCIGQHDALIVGPGVLGRLVGEEWKKENVQTCFYFRLTLTSNSTTNEAKRKTSRSSRRRSKYVSTTTKAFKIRPIAGTDGRSPWDTIGRYGMRNFMLDKKSETLMSIGNDGASAACEAEKAAGNWHITSYWS